MQFRNTIFFVFIAVLLSACNMTLAQDVTPPPGAVQQAQPTHSPAFPVQAPSLQNGAIIYAEKCAPCHGDSGLGDGPQGQQLPVPVTALGLPEVASQASPADWFLTVTLGNMDNFMPPFNSLSDQARWDVVAYAQSLSTTPEQISQGEELFNENCVACPIDLFSDQAQMAELSTVELVSLLTDGGEGIPPLGEALSEDELGAVAAYLRTLSFASSPAAGPAPATETEIPVEAESPPAEGTPVAAKQAEATPAASIALTGFGPVSGKLINGSSGDVPSGVSVTLRGFDHSTDENTTPEEVVSQTVETDASGAFRFEDMDLPEGRIFFVETKYAGVPFQSELALTEAGASALEIPALTVYESTTDTGALVTEELFVFTEFNPDGTLRIFEQFYISNQSDWVVMVETDGTSVPILPMPSNAVNAAFQASEDGASLVETDTGFALPPSAESYGIIAFYTVPFEKKVDLALPFAMPVFAVSVVVPDGIKVKSDQLNDDGVKEMQPGARFQVYSGNNLSADDVLSMNISGKVKTASTTIATDNRQILLIGAGAFGVVLILAGVWMYMRDRDKLEEDEFEYDEEDEDEFGSAEEVMDAIVALDDLHRAKKIPDEAYQARRAVLRERLKGLA